MTRPLLSLFAACFLVWLPAVQAQENVQADHEELRRLRSDVASALNSGDWEKLGQYLAQPFVFITADQKTITSVEQLKSYYDSLLRGEHYKYGIQKLHVEPQAEIETVFTGPDTGYCYGPVMHGVQLKSGVSFSVPGRWSAMLTRQDGKWKISMAHAGVNFLDNPLYTVGDQGSSAISTFLTTSVAVALLIAVVLLLIKQKRPAAG